MTDNAYFNDFVKGVAFTRAKGGRGIPYWRSPQLDVHLVDPETNISLDAVLRIIERELTHAGCGATRDVAIALLGLLAGVCPKEASPSSVFNDLLTRVVRGTLYINVVLPTRCDPTYAVTVGDCHVRPFDPEKLLYWANKGKSSYPFDVSALRGFASISPEPIGVTFIDIEQISLSALQAFAWKAGIESQFACDAYFHSLFEMQLALVPDRVRKATQVLEAGGLIYVDMESLIGSVFSRRLGLFRWRNSQQIQRAWAVMNSQAALNITLPPPDRLVGGQHWLETALGYAGIQGDTPLSKTLEIFCTLMQRGRQHQFAKARDEACLHFVIALDFLFGEKGRSTDSVAERVAVLTHHSATKSYTEQYSRIRSLYDARSKYVHEGTTIARIDAVDMERTATQVLWSFLSVAADGIHTTTDHWLRQIDYVQATIQAGRCVAESDLRGIGIRQVSVPFECGVMP